MNQENITVHHLGLTAILYYISTGMLCVGRVLYKNYCEHKVVFLLMEELVPKLSKRVTCLQCGYLFLIAPSPCVPSETMSTNSTASEDSVWEGSS